MSLRSQLNSHLYEVIFIFAGIFTIGMILFIITLNIEWKEHKQFTYDVYNQNYKLNINKYGNEKDVYNRPYILVVYYTKDFNMFKVFVDNHKININVKDEYGIPFLFSVLKSPDSKYLDYLLSNRTDINFNITDRDGNNIALTCVDFNKPEYYKKILSYLTDKHSVFFFKNKDGDTAYDRAKTYGNLSSFDKMY